MSLPYHKDALDHFGVIDGARILVVATPAKKAIQVSAPLIDFIDSESGVRVLIDYDPEFPLLLVRALDFIPPVNEPESANEGVYEGYANEAIAHFGSIEGATVLSTGSPARNALAVVGLFEIPSDVRVRYIIDYDPAFDHLLIRSVPVMSLTMQPSGSENAPGNSPVSQNTR